MASQLATCVLVSASKVSWPANYPYGLLFMAIIFPSSYIICSIVITHIIESLSVTPYMFCVTQKFSLASKINHIWSLDCQCHKIKYKVFLNGHIWSLDHQCYGNNVTHVDYLTSVELQGTS